MSFLRRAPALKLDKNRINLGPAIQVSAWTGIADSTGSANVYVYTDGTMAGIAEATPVQGYSGTFTGRKWKYNNIASSNYYIKANNVNAQGGSVSPVQSSGTLGNWTQLSSSINWGIAVSASDELTDFQLHVSSSSTGTPVLSTVNVSLVLTLAGIS